MRYDSHGAVIFKDIYGENLFWKKILVSNMIFSLKSTLNHSFHLPRLLPYTENVVPA